MGASSGEYQLRRARYQGVRRPHHLACQACRHVDLQPLPLALRRPDTIRSAMGPGMQQVDLRVLRDIGLQADATRHVQHRYQLPLRQLASEVHSERRALNRYSRRLHPGKGHRETTTERSLPDRAPQEGGGYFLAASRTRGGRTSFDLPGSPGDIPSVPHRPPRCGQRGRTGDIYDYDPNDNHATDIDGGGQRRGRADYDDEPPATRRRALSLTTPPTAHQAEVEPDGTPASNSESCRYAKAYSQ